MTKHQGTTNNAGGRLPVLTGGNWYQGARVDATYGFFSLSLSAPPLKRLGGMVLFDERHFDAADIQKGLQK